MQNSIQAPASTAGIQIRCSVTTGQPENRRLLLEYPMVGASGRVPRRMVLTSLEVPLRPGNKTIVKNDFAIPGFSSEKL